MERREASSGGRSKVEEQIRALMLQHKPELLFGCGVNIVFHQNSSTMISLSRRGKSGTLRVHRLFCAAPPQVLEAIVCSFFTRVSAKRSRELRSQIMDFLEENRQMALGRAIPPRTRPPRGEIYDLDEVERKVIELYVPERRAQLAAFEMAWSDRVTPSLMGKWIETPAGHPNLIIINRLLDDERVPRFYLEYIVYHEILHDLFPIRREAGRWIQHPAEFRHRERRFPYYEAARQWEKNNLQGLLAKRKRA
jgi:hypothetical protein